jgi:hypothetical protein
MSCCWFPSFLAGSLETFWNPKNPPAALLLLTNHTVQYQSYSKITKTVSWEQPGYYGFLLCAQGIFCSTSRGITLIESSKNRWFSRLSGRGGWSNRAAAQRRPKVSKLGLRGLSDYHSKEITVEAVRWGASGPIYRATLTGNLLMGGKLDNSSKPNQTRAKGSLPEKHCN